MRSVQAARGPRLRRAQTAALGQRPHGGATRASAAAALPDTPCHPPPVYSLPRSRTLHGNNLTGGLPDAWAAPGSFTALEQLTLSDNPLLGGTLPLSWGNQSEALPALQVGAACAARCACKARLTGGLPGHKARQRCGRAHPLPAAAVLRTGGRGRLDRLAAS